MDQDKINDEPVQKMTPNSRWNTAARITFKKWTHKMGEEEKIGQETETSRKWERDRPTDRKGHRFFFLK